MFTPRHLRAHRPTALPASPRAARIKTTPAVRGAGGRFLEAPVSGSKKPAIDGQLIILSAGDKSLFDESMPFFEVMGKRRWAPARRRAGGLGRGRRGAAGRLGCISQVRFSPHMPPSRPRPLAPVSLTPPPCSLFLGEVGAGARMKLVVNGM